MRRLLLLVMLTWLAMGGLYLAGSWKYSPEAVAATPLSLEGYLDEKLPEATETEADKKAKAQNFACYVCHGSYKEEELATVHAKADVGCVECHGESLAHRNDENNITPPETIYWPERIDPACKKCHETHDAPAHEVIARWKTCSPPKNKAEPIICTDCHGNHRMERRTVRWNKRTGQLIVEGNNEKCESSGATDK